MPTLYSYGALSDALVRSHHLFELTAASLRDLIDTGVSSKRLYHLPRAFCILGILPRKRPVMPTSYSCGNDLAPQKAFNDLASQKAFNDLASQKAFDQDGEDHAST